VLLLGRNQAKYLAERLRSIGIGCGLAHIRDFPIAITNLLGCRDGFGAEQRSTRFAHLDFLDILRDLGVYCSRDDDASRMLDAFCTRRFFLVQAIKWPFLESARNLRPSERSLTKHTVDHHLKQELEFLRPLAIICLGKVASYACSVCLNGVDFPFGSSMKLEDVRGKCFHGSLPSGIQVQIYPTALPVKKNMMRKGERKKILEEIRAVLRDHWDWQEWHVV